MQKKSFYYLIEQLSPILLLFSIIFDPGNIHFGIKNISFILFCIINIKKFNGKLILVPMFFILLFFISYTHSTLINIQINDGIASWNLTSFLFLVVLLYKRKTDRIHFVYNLYYMSLFFSIIIVICAFFIFVPVSSFISKLVLKWVTNNSDFVMIGYRKVMGLKHPCLYYRTSSICIIPECISLILLIKTKKQKYFFHFCFFFLELFLSGARANMIAAVLILTGVIFSYLLFKRKYIVISYLLFIIGICIISIVLFLIITEKEHSNVTKVGHLQSFYELFNNHFIRYFFIGSGPGTIMYSYALNDYTALTELSYFELIKSYGFIPTIMMLFALMTPIYGLWKSKAEKMIKLSLTVAYFSFFFVAGTNPLFIGSTGFTTIICMFFIYNHNLIAEVDISRNFKFIARISKLIKYNYDRHPSFDI